MNCNDGIYTKTIQSTSALTIHFTFFKELFSSLIHPPKLSLSACTLTLVRRCHIPAQSTTLFSWRAPV